MAGIGRLVPRKDSSSATDPSGGGDDDYYEDYESSDGQVTATLDVANYVDSGETLKSVEAGYGGSADCDSQADFCTADASTQVSFNTGESESGAAATDSNTTNDSYSGTLTTTNENVEIIKATHDSSAGITRKTGDPDRGSSGTDVEAEAVAELVGYTRIKLECSDTGDDEIVPPVALDDGNNDLPICSSFDPIDINVLDNDGGDSISIDSVSNPSNGTTATTSKNGTDWIRYTPSQKGEEVTFEYTISDVDGNTYTATVTVNVTDACGDITVEFEDPEGNPVEIDSANVEYNDDLEACVGSGTSVSCNVRLYYDGRDAVIEKSYIDTSEEYEVKETE